MVKVKYLLKNICPFGPQAKGHIIFEFSSKRSPDSWSMERSLHDNFPGFMGGEGEGGATYQFLPSPCLTQIS